MKKIILLSFVVLFGIELMSQTYALDNSVQLNAIGTSAPDAVTINWEPYAGATQYRVYRKALTAAAWGPVMATLTGTDSSYTDNTVVSGTLYEYRVDRTAPTNAYGYIVSGVNTKLNYNNGIMILLVDSFYTPVLNPEISQLITDYEADGWFVKQLIIDRNSSVASVKSKIITTFNQDPANTKAIMLLGRIPVPYSGLINPDGHPDHLGAWPADVFYGEMDGNWTDASINDNTSAGDPRNYNVPGDGKYDQSSLPSTSELQVGRVDMFNLPVFGESDTILLQNYLNKLHQFKTRGFIPNDLGVIEDNFSGYAEGFSSSGYTNLSTSVGVNNIYTADWLATLDTINALWSYGCGGGWYQGAGGICTSTEFATDSVQSVFNMLFGSYFGDWDVQNSFLRSPLGSGTVLTNVWAGRPHWQFHQMSMGYNIGYSALKTQNNGGTYYTSNLSPGYFGRWIHIALLGDPSLRMHYIAPPASLNSTEDANNVVHLSWFPSAEIVLGYHVYRKLTGSVNWTQINTSIITGTSFDDSTLVSGGDYEYMVRAGRDQQTASGIYENLSLGTKSNLSSTLAIVDLNSGDFNLFPNPATEELTIRINEIKDADLAVIVYNSLGETVINQQIQIVNNSIRLNVSNLSIGVYYLQIGNYSRKFIKS